MKKPQPQMVAETWCVKGSAPYTKQPPSSIPTRILKEVYTPLPCRYTETSDISIWINVLILVITIITLSVVY